MNDCVLEVIDLKKNYGSIEVLKGIKFQLRKGGIYGLIGNNGEGKTTMMRIILGLMKPCGGQILLNTTKKYIGYMPQTCRLIDRMSVIQTIIFFSMLRECESEEPIKLCEKFNLPTDKKVKLLSPGQQKKLLLILATIGDPDVYILDEPTAGLDPSSSLEVLEMIRKVNRKGNSILISSHILQDLNNICTDVMILKDGVLKSNEKLDEVICIKVGCLSDEQYEKVSSKYNITVNPDGTLVELNEKNERVPEIIRDFVQNGIDIYEITPGNLKNFALNIMEA